MKKLFKRKQPDFPYVEQEAKYHLGDLVRDKITGLEGIIIVTNFYLFNDIAYGIKSRKLNKNKEAVEHTIEECSLELVEEGAVTTDHPIKPFSFNLGDEVKTKIEGVKGVIQCRCNWINGCNNYGIREFGKALEKAENRSFWTEQGNIELVQENKSKMILIDEPKEVKRNAGNYTGGPVESSRCRT